MEMKVEFGSQAAKFCIEPAVYGRDLGRTVVLSIAGGGFSFLQLLSSDEAVTLAGALLVAAGHSDPIPSPEATESDFGAFAEAASERA